MPEVFIGQGLGEVLSTREPICWQLFQRAANGQAGSAYRWSGAEAAERYPVTTMLSTSYINGASRDRTGDLWLAKFLLEPPIFAEIA